MKIGFDVSQTGQSKAGCGYFAYSLLRELLDIDSINEYMLYPTFGDGYWDPDWLTSTINPQQSNVRRGLAHSDRLDLCQFWRRPPLELDALLGDVDIVHSNNFFCPVGLNRARLIYTLYDLSFIEHPEWTSEANRLVCFNGMFNASLYADWIVAISQYSRHHFLEVFPHYPAERVSVVYPASRFTYDPDLPQPAQLDPLSRNGFWLCVGTIEPRKNHLRLLQAYAYLKARQESVLPLVIAGGRGWMMDDFTARIAQLGLQQDVIILGYVDDHALHWLYQNCYATLYPALFEGFGLPVIEAMSLGAVVLTSSVTSVPEIVGEAGLLINPYSEDELLSGMLALVSNPDQHAWLREAAMRRAQQFSWTATARTVLEIYQQAMNAAMVGS